MTEQKWGMRSKTIVGGIFLALPAVTKIYAAFTGTDAEVTDEQAAALRDAAFTLIDSASVIVGAVLMWWGRNTASGKVTLLPNFQ